MSGLILLPLLGVAVWLFVVPQRRQMKEHRQLITSLAEGDPIITNSGIYGIIAELDGDVMYLEVAEGIELKMSRAAVARRITETEPTESPSSEASTEG
jgi:preprotein translocase subunit YajC